MADAASDREVLGQDADLAEPINSEGASTHEQQGRQLEQGEQPRSTGSEQQEQGQHGDTDHQKRQGAQGKQQDNTSTPRRHRRHPRLVRIVSFAVRAVLALEAAAWLYRTSYAIQRRRRGGVSSSEETTTDEAEARAADAADRLVDYLSGRASMEQIMDLGSEELLGAAEILDTDDLEELGLSKDAGDQLKASVRDMVEEMRRARKPIPLSGEQKEPAASKDVAAASTVPEAAGLIMDRPAPQVPTATASKAPLLPNTSKTHLAVPQSKQAEDSGGSQPKRRFPSRRSTANSQGKDNADDR